MKNGADLNDMMVFLAVVEAGGFTQAADRLGLPKANVSRKVSRLEAQLGITLLERTTRSQVLTVAGRAYLQHCKRIHEEVLLAEADVHQELDTLKGTIRVGVSVGIGQDIIKPALGRFLKDYPDIDVELILENRRVDLIEEGYDLVLRIGQLEDSSLVARSLGKIWRKFYCSPGYLEEVGSIETPEQVCDCDFLMMSSIRKNRRTLVESEDREVELNLTPKLLTDDFSIVKQCALEGSGLAILPSYMCDKEVQEGKLVNTLPAWRMKSIELFALYPRHRARIPKVGAFLEFVTMLCKTRLEV